MGYVAVQGGKSAIEQSILRTGYERIQDGRILDVKDIQAAMRPLIDEVMSEASLYDEELAALAIKQAGGSVEEAVFLLRAHRSTLPRLYYSNPAESSDMFVTRRISASFKDIPGGQLLGSSKDYSQRFLNFDLVDETPESARNAKRMMEERMEGEHRLNLRKLPKVLDYLTSQGLHAQLPDDDTAPDDITKKSIRFPSSRSERLQTLTRGQTGAVTSLGYAQIRGYGVGSHPNVGELRVGELPVTILGEDAEDAYYIGSVTVTEVESFITSDHQEEDGSTVVMFEVGYGLVFGQNESKAIAMSVLDYSLEHPVANDPTTDEEFVLLHIDAVESSGFISHLKLPHYVTFQSLLDGVRAIKEAHDGV